MSTIKQYSAGNYYTDNTFQSYNDNANSFLSGLGISSGTSGNSSTVNLSDYAMIKKGTYGKLMKAYYAKEKTEKAQASKDTQTRLDQMAQDAASLSKSAQALMQDSLWEKGDRDAILKAVKGLVDDYNTTLEGAGKSNTKNVLRDASWLTKTTSVNEKLLSKVGISIGSDNKLSIDEDAFKEADISTLKSLFTGYGSYASKVADKGNSIALAAAKAGGTYTNRGNYSDILSQLISGRIDTKE